MSGGWGFAQPALLWGLLLLPLLVLERRRLRRRDQVPYPPLQLRATGRRRLPDWLESVVELCLVAVLLVGAAGPQRRLPVELMEDAGIDVLLVLDVSLSMLAEDIAPNRLEALRGVASGFVARSGGHRVGILIFAKDVYVQSPLTTDREAVHSLLESVTVHTLSASKSGGTAVGDALLIATEQLRQRRVEGRDQAIVLITDGESNKGLDPRLAARYARDHGVRVYAIGIGGTAPTAVTFEGRPVGGAETPYLAVLDDRQLRAVAQAAEGRYYRAQDGDALGAVFAELSRLESAPFEQRTVEIEKAIGGWLARAALVFLVLYLLLSGVVLRRPLR